MIEDDCADKVIPHPNISSHVLDKVIEHYKNAKPTGPGDAVAATNRSVEDELIMIFGAGFVNFEQATLFDLMLVSPHPLLSIPWI
jgi:S-phase kinase-associated protein 1